ncbi:MAG: hypothetical protein LBS06_02545 [Treponema sp.]|jgi:hypothetical protein|nr:hypothetical protein [Treponema sp.]
MTGFFPRRRIAALLALGLWGLSALAGLDLATAKIVDDSSLRITLKDRWFTEAPGRVLARRRELLTLDGGGRVEVRAEGGQDEFMIVLAREWKPAGAPVSFPGWAQGSWVLTRRKDTGEPARIRVFPRSDPNAYVQFRPFSQDRCRMDVVIYNAYLLRSLPLPVPFERLYTMPLEEIFGLAGDKFPRRFFDIDPAGYRDTRRFMDQVRERLPEIGFADDGAMDEKGEYVFIDSLKPQPAGKEGLNCSGFVKWLVDGLLRPLTGGRLPIAPLKEPAGGRKSSFSEELEQLRDPFFGLDWTRNLAARANTVFRSPARGVIEEFEVRESPFAEVIARKGAAGTIRPYPGFLENAGFGIEGLQPLLYTLAAEAPGRLYLASVNAELAAPRGPRMRQHFHTAALIPYFNEYGNFHIAVFESAEATSFAAFKGRYPDHYVNLVTIPLEPDFEP